jgi:hypothetical protein
MKIRKEAISNNFELGIFGLGYESRSVSAFEKYKSLIDNNIAVGYDTHTNCLHYQSNKTQFGVGCEDVFEGNNTKVFSKVHEFINTKDYITPINCLIDITVMSRHRLATLICFLIDNLPLRSTITIVYSLSSFVEPPEGVSPIRVVGEITEQLSGNLGNLSLPSSLVIGLGYEKDKALGVYNYLDSTYTFLFVPKSSEERFEAEVMKNNDSLFRSTPKSNIFYYDVSAPYSTYLDLKSLILDISDFSRPLLIPLGPKILSALSVIIGKELHPELPVWRASSEYNEVPTERPSSGTEISFTIDI